MGDGGKGSRQRTTDQQKFADNFERIFRKPLAEAAEKISEIVDKQNIDMERERAKKNESTS